MATKKSIGLKLVQNLFLDFYIKENHANKLHYLEYVEIVLYNSYDKTNKHIYKAVLADYSKDYYLCVDLDKIKELDPYIIKYRNTSKRYTFFNATVYEGKNSFKNCSKGHSFFFIYDKNNNTVSEFTSREDYNIEHRKFVKNFFQRIYSNNVKIFFEDWDRLLDSQYLQYLECGPLFRENENNFFYKDQDYSLIWMLWFLEMILSNPKLSTEEIKLKNRELLSNTKKLICRITIFYAKFVDSMANEYKIISQKKHIEKSAPLKLIQYPYHPEKEVSDQNSDKLALFLDVYIKKKHAKKLHLLDYTEIVLYNSCDKNNRTIYKAALADYSKADVYTNLENVKELEPYINKYRNTAKRYTLFSALIHTQHSPGHSFFYIYDKKNNVVTRFDSEEHGAAHATKSIKRFFELIYSDNIKVIFGNYERLFGLQTFHNLRSSLFRDDKNDFIYKQQDYSVIWALWFLEMILTNPKLTIDQIKLKTYTLFFEGKDLICKIAAGYAQFADKTTSKYKIVYPKRKPPQKAKTRTCNSI